MRDSSEQRRTLSRSSINMDTFGEGLSTTALEPVGTKPRAPPIEESKRRVEAHGGATILVAIRLVIVESIFKQFFCCCGEFKAYNDTLIVS